MKEKKILVYFLCTLIFVLLFTTIRSTVSASKHTHCYALLSSVDNNSKVSSQIIESKCFDTFSEAIQAATNGRVILDPSIKPQDVDDLILNKMDSKAIDTQVVIGIDWDESYYGGNSYTWVVSGNGCTSTTSYSVANMPSGWDNQVSSTKAYSNCNFIHYRDINFGTPSFSCSSSCSIMGTMDNATSSERWVWNP